MRPGQVLTDDDLRREAEAAVEASGMNQSQVADALGVHRSTVSRALSQTGGTFTTAQRQIIALLTDYVVEEAYVVRKG